MKAAKARQECLTATVKVPAWQSKFSFPKKRAVIQLPITAARARPGAPCPPDPPRGRRGLGRGARKGSLFIAKGQFQTSALRVPLAAASFAFRIETLFTIMDRSPFIQARQLPARPACRGPWCEDQERIDAI